MVVFEKLEAFLDWGGTKKDIVFVVLSGLAMIAALIGVPTPIDPSWLAIILCGVPIILGAIIGLVTEFDIKADVLVSIALLAAIATGEIFAAGEVAVIMQLGALLEEITVAKVRAGIERLLNLSPRTARLIDGANERIIDAEAVKTNDALRVLPGEIIPADGVITKGTTSVDTSVMTGESMPVDKTIGDEVSGGTINRFGVFEMKASRPGTDSALQRMIRLVQSADAGKARIVNLADRWATWIVVIALTAAVLTYFVTGEIMRSVAILVVFCPCALVLATPTAIMAAIGNVSKRGILVREGDALERLASVDAVVFDKTGTLTYGVPTVTAVVSTNPNRTDRSLYDLVAAAELHSEHPLGKAIVKSYTDNHGNPGAPSDFTLVPGRGVRAVVDTHTVLAGNAAFLGESHIPFGTDAINDLIAPHLNDGCTLIYIAVDGEFAGFLALADTIREAAPSVIHDVRSQNIIPVLLTGDAEASARHIAKLAGVPECKASFLPEDKLQYIEKSEAIGRHVAMVGDGINDAPALKRAHVGIAMGGIGSDIAVEAADIALIRDDINQLPHLLRLSRHMMTVIKYNLIFSMALNFIAIILAILGILDPIMGALVHNAGSIFVVINSALLLKWRSVAIQPAHQNVPVMP